MNRKIWKFLNWIFATGIWVQPFVFRAVIWFFNEVCFADISYFILFLISFIPTIYIWSENERLKASGKQYFGIEDTFHDRPTQYSSPLKIQAMYPQVDERFLFDKPQGVVFGRIEDGVIKKQVRYLCKPLQAENYRDGHVLIVGGSGSGKSSSIIIPTLLNSAIGMFCIDIKGELWRKTRRFDDEDVVIIDFQDRGKYGWDALYTLNQKATISDQNIREQMEEISNALIPISAKDHAEFWKQSARSLLTGELIGLYKQKKIHNLSELLNEILSVDARKLVKELIDGATPKATELKFLSSFLNLADETMSGVVQQQQESLKIFIDADIQYGFETNTRQANVTMLEQKKAVFLAVREEKLESYYNVINLIITQVFASLIKRPEDKEPLLVVIDEFARLCARGQTPYLHNGILLTGRSRNITLVLVTQSYEALLNAYTKPDVQSIVANCSYLVCLDVRSQETAKSICSMAGNYKEREKTWSGSGSKRSISTSYRDKPILEPSDLSKLVQMDEVVLITADFAYCRVKKSSYFNDDILAPLSQKIQKYNREAFEIEETGELKAEEPVSGIQELLEEPADCLADIIKRQWKKINKNIKETILLEVQQYEKEIKKWKKKK